MKNLRSPLKLGDLGEKKREREENETNLPILRSCRLWRVERSETETRTDEGRVSLDKTITDSGVAQVSRPSVLVVAG